VQTRQVQTRQAQARHGQTRQALHGGSRRLDLTQAEGHDGRQAEQDHHRRHDQHDGGQDPVRPGPDRAILAAARFGGTDEPAAGPDDGQPGRQVDVPEGDLEHVGRVGHQAQAGQLRRQPSGGDPAAAPGGRRHVGDAVGGAVTGRLRPDARRLRPPELAPQRIAQVTDAVGQQQVGDEGADHDSGRDVGLADRGRVRRIGRDLADLGGAELAHQAAGRPG